MRLDQVLRFLVSEDPRFCDKSHAKRDLKRKACPAAGDNINREFRMLPKLELVLCHIKIAARNLAQPNIGRADNEFSLRVTHRRRPVTAPAALMEHQLAVL